MTEELCPNNHVRTVENTSFVRDNQRNRTKRVCLDCRRESYQPRGRPAAHEAQKRRTTELHEDVEDLLNFGASFEEIIQRAGFSTWKRMKTSLRRRERFDLLERLEVKAVKGSERDLFIVNGGQLTESRNRVR